LALIPARVKLFAGKGDLPVLVGEIVALGAHRTSPAFWQNSGAGQFLLRCARLGALRLG
jgi:hypothetical protein